MSVWRSARRACSAVAFDLFELGLDALAVLCIAEIVAAHADDASALGQGAVAKGLKQGGHEFAPHQVTGATEKNKIKSHAETDV